MGKEIKGIFIKNRRGFGFVEKEDKREGERDIYISPADQKGAMTGDTVRVDLIPECYWDTDRPEGIITRIEKRSVTQVTGKYTARKNGAVVLPVNGKEAFPVRISRGDNSGAVSGDMVTAQITEYPRDGRDACGKVISVVASKDDPYADLKGIIRSKNLYFTFPSSAAAQAAAISKKGISEEEKDGRRDLRDKNIFTIDGADSKDFDDAVSIEKNSRGNYVLGVHIADVSHYVTEGSPLDEEALKRGNSVYVLNLVVPMLPASLSNGICSLNEGEDRLTLTCEMEIDTAGDIVSHDIYESVIRSKHRLVYDDISDILENGDKDLISRYRDIYDDLLLMNELYMILSKKRSARGSIDFDVDEAYIVLDEKGVPVDIRPAERRTANRLIEEFMLAANETVAEHFYWLEVPFIYRVHEKPEAKKMVELKHFLEKLNLSLKGNPAGISPQALADVLSAAEGTDCESIVKSVILKSMQKAYYGTDCGGHFGLSLKYYSHFTSPIRRYPDLFIHRVIKKQIHGQLDENEISHLASAAVEAAEKSSLTERTAMETERQAEKIKKAQYMEQFIGCKFTGIISGVTSFGFFVQLPDTVEGLVRISELNDDYYEVDDSSMLLRGELTGRTYRLGDRVRVRCVAANRYNGEVDFMVLPPKTKKKKKKGKRK